MLLSVIIPVFNTNPKFLSECLESLKQINLDNNNYEIVIVNDGSTSKHTLLFLNNLELTENFKLLNIINGGPGHARNIGIQNALGRYIFPLDSDDKISSNFNLFIDTILNTNNIDVLYGNIRVFGDKNYKKRTPKYNPLTLFFKENIIPACSFYKKTIHQKVGGYDASLKSIEDYDFWIKVALITNKIKHLNHSAYYYRIIHDGNSRMQNSMSTYQKDIKAIRNQIPLTREQLNSFFIKAFKKNNKSQIFNLIKHYYFEKKLKKPLLYHFFTSLYFDQICKPLNVSLIDLEIYLDINFKRKKRLLIALLIYLYSPNLYKLILKLGGFSFNYQFI